jgi:hypothetical protein
MVRSREAETICRLSAEKDTLDVRVVQDDRLKGEGEEV